MENKLKNLIYLAGLLDGEGHFRTIAVRAGNRRKKKYNTFSIIFVQSEKNEGQEVCGWLKENYGGSVSKTDHRKYNPNSSIIWRWELRGKKAESLAMQLSQYCLIKQKQIKEAFFNLSCPPEQT